MTFRVAALAALLALAAPAVAGEVRVNGFGQVIAGQVLQNNRSASDLAYENHPSFAPESLFAIQLNAPLTERLEAVAQILARGREDYEPKFSWAYLRYTVSDHWQVKLGRQRTPIFNYSDVLDVGAAYPFLRPPRSVYRTEFSNIEGINFGANYSLGRWELSPQLMYGANDEEATTNDGKMRLHAQSRHYILTALDAQYDDWLRLRIGYGTNIGSIDILDPGYQALLQGLRASGNERSADLLDYKNDRTVYRSAGFELQRRGAFLTGEYIQYLVEDSLVGEGKGWYLSAGYRQGAWTPYVSWGRSIAGNDGRASAAASSPFNAFVAQAEASGRWDTKEYNVGVRYDLRPNVALKAEFAHEKSRISDRGDADTIAAGVVFTY